MAVSVVVAVARALELAALGKRCKNLDPVACIKLEAAAKKLIGKAVSRLGRRPKRSK